MGKSINYKAVVEFDSTAVHFTAFGRKTFLSKSSLSYNRKRYITVPSSSRLNTKEWENDMVNRVLDTFKGTDWTTVKNIEY